MIFKVGITVIAILVTFMTACFANEIKCFKHVKKDKHVTICRIITYFIELLVVGLFNYTYIYVEVYKDMNIMILSLGEYFLQIFAVLFIIFIQAILVYIASSELSETMYSIIHKKQQKLNN